MLGWLFKTVAVDNRKVNLYFFLTPHILDEDDFSDLQLKISNLQASSRPSSTSARRRLEMVDPEVGHAKRAQAPR